MAAISTIVAVASLAVGAVGAYQQKEAQDEARKDQKRAEHENRKAKSEQEAIQAQKRAEERRQQLREERIKRARVIQASSNTGVSSSSGEMGAIGNLATQSSAQIGANIGLGMHADNISQFSQNAADYMSSASNHMVDANQWGQIGGLAMNVGSKAASIFGTPTTDTGSLKPAGWDNSFDNPADYG